MQEIIGSHSELLIFTQQLRPIPSTHTTIASFYYPMQLFVLHLFSSSKSIVYSERCHSSSLSPAYIQASKPFAFYPRPQNLSSHCPCPWPAPSAMELAFAWARLLFSPCLPFYITRRLVPLLWFFPMPKRDPPPILQILAPFPLVSRLSIALLL